MNFASIPTHQPYANQALNNIYNMLFCDDLEVYKANGQLLTGYPWNVFFAEEPPVENLQFITKDNRLESRQRLLAYRMLSGKGAAIEQKELLGVIIEVAMPEGLDVLAAYKDGRARYINYSGRIVVWEVPTEESNKLIDQLFAASEETVNQIGPWNEDRRPFPVEDMVRLNFLVSDGLYFGEAPFSVMQNEPMGAPVIGAATQLMAFLVNNTLEE